LIEWRQVKAVVFDVDGTLYPLLPVRLRMACALGMHALRGGYRDVRLLREFRRNREHLSDTRQPVTFQYKDPYVRALVEEWIHRRPLHVVKNYRFTHIERVFDALRVRGIKIGICSDYPAVEKVASLGLAADVAVCAQDVGYFKPHPAGLVRIVDTLGIAPDQCLMIGDRDNRDGAAARAIAMPFLLCKGRNFYIDMLNSLERDTTHV
jgi:HAD superfamily hydrolase (TIGR01549 family)